jgi:hypothetical protein
MRAPWVVALSVLILSACSTKQAIKPIVASPSAMPARSKPLAAMQPDPQFPTLPFDLPQKTPEQQVQIVGALWIQAAAAFASVRGDKAALKQYILTETCHGSGENRSGP